MNSKQQQGSAFRTDDLLRLMRIWGWTSMSIIGQRNTRLGAMVLEREDLPSPEGETPDSQDTNQKPGKKPGQESGQDHDLDPERPLIDPNGRMGKKEGWMSYWAYPNPDGSLRWLVPTSDRKGRFLAFYNQATLRAKVLALVWRSSAMLQSKWINRVLGIRPMAVRFPQTFLQSERGQWTAGVPLFLGTKGEDRKALALVPASKHGLHPADPEHYGELDRSSKDHFVKIALGERSGKLLENEAASIDWLNEQKPGFRYPKHHTSLLSEGLLPLEDVAPKSGKRETRFGPIHARFVAELMAADHAPDTPQTQFWNKLMDMASHLPEQQWAKDVHTILQRLLDGPALPMQRIHGDFTPWNCWIDAHTQQLAVYDWELSKTAPALFDLFHFVVQGEALLGQNPAVQNTPASATVDRLENLLASAMGQPALEAAFAEGGLDPERQLHAYLCWMLCYYGPGYAQRIKKGQASPAEARLMQVWSKWLRRHASACTERTMRRQFLAQLGEQLTDAGIALLKHRHGPLEELPLESDLDVLGPKEGVTKLLHRWEKHPLLVGIRFRKAPGMINAMLLFVDGDVLSLDFLHAFQRKDLIYARAEEALAEACLDDQTGCLVLPASRDLEYLTAFYQFNHAGMPKAYLDWFKALPAQAQSQALEHLSRCTDDPAFQLEQCSEHQPELVARWKARVNQWPENRFWHRAMRRMEHVLRSMLDPFRERGFTVTLSGADGAGKSTILSDLEQTLRKRFRRKVVVLRHRPAVLPMLSAWKHGRQEAERRAAVRLPRKGTNRNKLSSLLRFGYYYSDYLLGQFYVWFRYVLRGYVVLYDRYYFDFIVDGKRSNLHLDPRLATAGWRLLFKPRRNYFLYAPAAVIRKRKQELDLDAIGELNGGYLALFRKLSERGTSGPKHPRYTPVINLDRKRTLRRILEDMQHQLRLPA